MSASYDCSLESEVRKTNRLPRSFSNLQPVGKQRESQVEEKKASARRRTSEQNLITTCSRMGQAVVQNPWRHCAHVWRDLSNACWQTRSYIVGTPNIRNSPGFPAFGICTCRTG